MLLLGCRFPIAGYYTPIIFTKRLSVKRQICEVNSCQNGGSCIQDLDTIRCLCSDGFRGHTCEGKHILKQLRKE